MATKRDSDKRDSVFSSPFDEMLEKNWKQFEELYNGAPLRARPGRPPRYESQPYTPRPARLRPASPRPPETPAPAPPPSPKPAAPPRLATPPRPAAPAPPRPSPAPADVVSPETRRILNERFGEGWRHEIDERRREGDEIVVRCRLVVPDQKSPIVQLGRAPLAPSGDGGAVSGSVGGIPFSVGTEGASSGDAEEAAFRKAVNDALAKCATSPY